MMYWKGWSIVRQLPKMSMKNKYCTLLKVREYHIQHNLAILLAIDLKRTLIQDGAETVVG